MKFSLKVLNGQLTHLAGSCMVVYISNIHVHDLSQLYRIYPAIRQVFCPSRITSNN